MKSIRLRVWHLVWAFVLLPSAVMLGAESQTIIIQALTPEADPESAISYDTERGIAVVTNRFVARYQDAVLQADNGELNLKTGELAVQGNVDLRRDNQSWRGEALIYNFLTREIRTDEFRTGRRPFFAAGRRVAADIEGMTYEANEAFVTLDDVSEPSARIRAKKLVIAPGQYFEAHHAVFYAGNIPFFYLPYVRYDLETSASHFTVTPGYRNRYGPFLLGTYHWYHSERLQGEMHLDYRLKRGVGLGPDLKYDAGRLGQGDLRFYYLYDQDPDETFSTSGEEVPRNRERLSFTHRATLRTNLYAQVVLRQQSDPYVLRDFFESEYEQNNQPSSFLEVQQLWPNFSLNLLAQPQVNDFYETVERFPDVKLVAARQRVLSTPLFYEADSSIGYYRRNFASGTTTNDYAAFRADTFHQILWPMKVVDGITLAPRVGGRATYYGETERRSDLAQQDRAVLNTGAELSAKASRLWAGTRSRFLDMDGLRHIVQPSLNYAFTPEPNTLPPELPQFDSEWPSLRLLPVVFPDYNSIDSIDSQNVLRLSLRNRLQTKRDDKVDDLVHWALVTDWRLDPRDDQATFADLYSDLDLKPRSWLTLTSEIRYGIDEGRVRLADHRMTLVPSSRWSWAIGHRYLRDEPELGYPEGNNLFTSTFYYRLNENWGFRVSHRYEARDGTLEQQQYSIYRDFRSWTGALSFRVLDNRNEPIDYSVAFTFSLKAFPRYGMGDDSNRPSLLLGG